MSDMKCPFCNKQLQPTLCQSDEYWCENYDCPRTSIEWTGSQKLWQELIRTRKALDVALDWLEQVATSAKCDNDLCREFTKRKLAEIKTALEQKDNK